MASPLSLREKLFIGFIIGLAIIIVVLAVLFATKDTQHADEKRGELKIEVCLSQDCITAASELLNSLDTTIKPCDDFFMFSCGGWIKKNPIPSTKESWDVSYKLKTQIDSLIKTNIESSETRARYSSVDAVIKGMKYFDSCMNTTLINSLGGEPVRKMITEYGSCSAIDSSWDENAWNFTTTLTKMLKELGVAGFFEMKVKLDAESKSSTYVITVDEPNHFRLLVEIWTYADVKARAAYISFMTSILNVVGNVSAADVNDILNFEEDITSIKDSSGYQPEYNRGTLAQFISSVGDAPINWLNLLREVFHDTGYVIDDKVQIVVNGMKFFKNLTDLIKRTPKRTLANFMMWQIIDKYAVNFGKNNLNYYTTFMNAIDATSNNPVKRKDFCLAQSMKINAFGMPLSRIFVDKRFSANDKKWIENMVDRLKEVFLSNLKTNTWMDKTTNTAAKEKVEATIQSIGYPSYLVHNSQLDELFSDVVANMATYFDNTVSLTKSFNKRGIAKVGKPIQRDSWAMTPVEVNAYYDDSYTKVVFPAAMLQPPFYDGNYTGAINYGAIGSTVGHELTHGFDDAGKDFDKNGKRVLWWTSETLEKFNKNAQCLIYQYSNFTFHGIRVDGKVSLSENIADNAGLKVAYQAYKQWKKEYGFEPRLPGTSLTSDQIFFISFAQSWCSSFTKESGKASFGNYSPTPWRVNGTIRNSAEFAQAFSCPSSAPMNPANKCTLW